MIINKRNEKLNKESTLIQSEANCKIIPVETIIEQKQLG